MDKAPFDTAYDAAITGCNECHVGTGHPYVRYQSPTENPQAFPGDAGDRLVRAGR